MTTGTTTSPTTDDPAQEPSHRGRLARSTDCLLRAVRFAEAVEQVTRLAVAVGDLIDRLPM